MFSVPLFENYSISKMIIDILPSHVDSSAPPVILLIVTFSVASHWSTILTTSRYEMEVTSSLYALIRHRRARRWEINSRRTSRPVPTDEAIGVQVSGACQDIPSKANDNLLYYDLPTTNTDTQHGDTGEKEESKLKSKFWSN